MAKKITVIRKYRPEFKHKSTLQMAQVVEYIASRTGLNTGEILLNVYELRDTIVNAHRNGQAVKIEGLGTFTPPCAWTVVWMCSSVQMCKCCAT